MDFYCATYDSVRERIFLRVEHFSFAFLCDSVANLLFYRRDWMRSARVLKSLTPWTS